MESAWGIDHGEVSKGLPSAVKAGGGGGYGSLLRGKNSAGKQGAKYGHLLPSMRSSGKERGGQLKEVLAQSRTEHWVRNPAKSRGIRARLLTEDSNARRQGFKTGKSSALDRGYRGRVNPMKELP